MSLVTYHELVGLVEQGVLTNVRPELINGSSIDVELGPWVWVEQPRGGVVDLANKQVPAMSKHSLVDHPYALAPGEFVLAQTRQVFNMPDDLSAEFRLKSSTARAGLEQSLAVWCDPCWHGSVLTLELRNNLQHHRLLLKSGMKIGQVIFHRGTPVPHDQSYAARGQYNNDTEAQPSKGVR